MRQHWVLTTWNAQAMAGFPASIAAPLARCALWSRSLAVHLAVRDKGVLWIGIDSSERREPPDHTAAPGGPFSRPEITRCSRWPAAPQRGRQANSRTSAACPTLVRRLRNTAVAMVAPRRSVEPDRSGEETGREHEIEGTPVLHAVDRLGRFHGGGAHPAPAGGAPPPPPPNDALLN